MSEGVARRTRRKIRRQQRSHQAGNSQRTLRARAERERARRRRAVGVFQPYGKIAPDVMRYGFAPKRTSKYARMPHASHECRPECRPLGHV